MFIDLSDVVLQKTLPLKEFQTKGRKVSTIRVQIGVFSDKVCTYYLSFYDDDIDKLTSLQVGSIVSCRVWLNGRSNPDLSFSYHSLTFEDFI